MKFVRFRPTDRKKIPSDISRIERQTACPNIFANVSPFRTRLAIENGNDMRRKEVSVAPRGYKTVNIEQSSSHGVGFQLIEDPDVKLDAK